MELKEARYILAIARHQSIGKAAESLYISQPSLSKYLKNLEERLGAVQPPRKPLLPDLHG